MNNMNGHQFKYSYEIDPESDITAARVIRLVGRNKKVLELGCGSGHMSRVLKDLSGCSITGVEIDKKAAKEAFKHCRDVKVCDLDQTDLAGLLRGETFDVVVMADVLEHLKYPENTLLQCKRLLAPEGKIVISIPNTAYAGVIACLMVNQFTYSDLGILDRTHLRFFTGPSFRSMITGLGFFVENWETHEVAVEFTDFKDYFQELPETIRDFLLKGPDAQAYQFILSIRPLQENGTGKNPCLSSGLDKKVSDCINARNNWFLKQHPPSCKFKNVGENSQSTFDRVIRALRRLLKSDPKK